jgi:hypothetical protein
MRGWSPGARSNPSGANYTRADQGYIAPQGGGHIAGHVGKAASSPISLQHELERASQSTGNGMIKPK